MASILQQVPKVLARSADFSVTALSYGARVMEAKPAPGDNPGDYPNPTNVFLIYITQENNHHWIARHMYAPAGADPDVTAADLYDIAKRDDQTSPYRVGDSFSDLVWDGSCYLYLVLDLDDAEFISANAPEFDAIQFHDRKPILGTNPVAYRNYDANFSFYNGRIMTVATRSAFRCINYFKDETGGSLKFPQIRFYGFEIRFQARYIDGTLRPHDIDPDGQNQGPRTLHVELEYLAA